MCPNGVERPALSAYHVCLVAPSIGPAQFSAFCPLAHLHGSPISNLYVALFGLHQAFLTKDTRK